MLIIDQGDNIEVSLYNYIGMINPIKVTITRIYLTGQLSRLQASSIDQLSKVSSSKR